MVLNGRGLKKVRLSDSDFPTKITRQHRNGKGDWIGHQADDPEPILYLSGTLMSPKWSEEEFFKLTGCRFRCFSYAYCGFGSPLISYRHMKAMDTCLKLGVRIFLDSGAHTFHNMIYKGQNAQVAKASGPDRRKFVLDKVEPYLDQYSKYLKWCYGNKKFFDFYVTLDADRNCPIIWSCTHRLEEMGVFPVPVYHGDQSLDWVRKYIDEGHKIIGVGLSRNGKPTQDAVRRYYDTVLSFCHKRKVACHGFAVTGDLMWEFPWYSADSTTWLKAAAFGKVLDIRPEKQRTALIHVSTHYSARTSYGQFDNLAPSVRKYLRDEVERRGFDWDLVQLEIPYRAMYNAKILMEAMTLKNRNKAPYARWKPVISV